MKTSIYEEIEKIVKYGINKGLLNEEDSVYCRNRILGVLHIDDFHEEGIEGEDIESPVHVLDNILNWAYENGRLESNTPVYRDILGSEIMNCLMPRPSEVIEKFYSLYEEDPKKATEYFYGLSKNSNYIHMDRVEKNLVWKAETEYGYMDITINLSKPEKDPRAIAAARNMASSSYPKCLLCRENEGYSGRLNHPPRQNHRIIPITLKGEKWYFQYSPYVYYNEHCIVLKDAHEPMAITESTFERILEFVYKFPHYFMGSNADLPIVGGSILSHDHFQGGSYEFAMAKAPIEHFFAVKGYEGVNIGVVKWPMSVIRLEGRDRNKLSRLGGFILDRWRNYSDETVDVVCRTGDVQHNTITPIARKRGDYFELDLVLRNNRTSSEYPYGIFHPHSELHHIKKENIGLIEVMGLAVLPARLKDELDRISFYLLNPHKERDLETEEPLKKHIPWYYELKEKYQSFSENNIKSILQREVGLKFVSVLEHAGVFKRDETGKKAFMRFIRSLSQ